MFRMSTKNFVSTLNFEENERSCIVSNQANKDDDSINIFHLAQKICIKFNHCSLFHLKTNTISNKIMCTKKKIVDCFLSIKRNKDFIKVNSASSVNNSD